MTIKSQLNGGPTDWILRLLVGLILGWGINELSYIRDELRQLDQRITARERDKFTDEDGQSHDDRITELSSALERKADRDRVVQLGEDLQNKADKDDVPPEFVEERLDRHDDMFTELDARHREDIHALELLHRQK